MTKENAGIRAAAALTACLSLPLAAQQPVEPPPEKVELPEVEQGLEGEIRIACSDLVFRLLQHIAKDFRSQAAGVETVASGGGSGRSLQLLSEGKLEIAITTRPLGQAQRAALEKGGRAFVELPIAIEALAMLVPKDNDWVDYLTVDELKKLWAPADGVRTWHDIRATWPEVELERFVRNPPTGFAQLLRPVVGPEARSLGGAQLVRTPQLLDRLTDTRGGIAITDAVIASQAPTDQVRLVRVDSGDGPCSPTKLDIGHGRYSSLSRPILLYVDKASLERPEVRAFVAFFLADCRRVADDFRLVAVAGPLRRAAERILERRESGTRFLDEEGKPKEGTLAELYR